MSAHDAYRIIGSQNVAYAASGGASAASAVLGSQTYWVMVSAVGAVTATNAGVRIAIGDGTPTASATSTLVPLNYPLIFACTPGQKVAVISTDAGTGTLNVAELS